VVEIGPGTGLVTRWLVAAGARVVAVEPDQNMAAHLAAAVSGDLEIIRGTVEQAPLPQDRFDLAVAATSFRWVGQDAGMPKPGGVIRPGGWAAVWRTSFDDPDRPNAFRDALQARTGDGDPGRQRNSRFQLDAAARCRDLAGRAGLTDVNHNLIRWTAELDTAHLRGPVRLDDQDPPAARRRTAGHPGPDLPAGRPRLRRPGTAAIDDRDVHRPPPGPERVSPPGQFLGEQNAGSVRSPVNVTVTAGSSRRIRERVATPTRSRTVVVYQA
jgi:Methyltransferase domain